MNKTYEFKGRKYSLKEHDLNLMNAAAPLLIKYREILYRNTCSIDTSLLEETEYELEHLNKAATELKNESVIDKKQIAELETKIKKHEDMLKSPALISLKKYLNDMEALAMYEILTDCEFTAGILNKILVQTDSGKLPGIKSDDLKDRDSLDFIKAVTGDFFLLAIKNKNRLSALKA